MQFLLFRVGHTRFAIDAFSIQLIHKVRPVTRLPYVASYVSGLVNIEGAVMAQVDMRQLLQLPAVQEGELLILNHNGCLMALVVDQAQEKAVVDGDGVRDSQVYAGEDAEAQDMSAIAATAGFADYIQCELMINGDTYLQVRADALFRLIKPEAVMAGEAGIVARQGLAKHHEKQAEDTRAYLTFRLGKETLALPLLQIGEVIEFDQFTRIPGAPGFIKGLAVLRAQPLLVIACNTLLGLKEEEQGITRPVLIIEFQQHALGLQVDEVFGIQHIADSRVIKETSDVSFVDSYVIDDNQRIILLLNLNSVFEAKSAKVIAQYLPRVEKNRQAKKIETIKLLKVEMGKEMYAIPIERVQRIAEQKQYAKITGDSKGIVGTVDIDGNIIPVVSMSQQLNVAQCEHTEQWVVINFNAQQWALCVSRATTLIDLDVETIDYSSSGRASVKGIASHKGELISILDFEWLKESAGRA